MLTQDHLKEVLHYDLPTGIFTWIKSSTRTDTLGKTAGWVNPTCGYRYVQLKGKNYAVHRLAFLYVNGMFPVETVDHINRNPLDNRWCNLREASYTENLRNRLKTARNTSGFVGVCKSRNGLKWVAYIKIDKKSKNLGTFNTAEEASEAYKAYARILHGRFYCESPISLVD